MKDSIFIINLVSTKNNSRVAALLQYSFAGTSLAYEPETDMEYAKGVEVILPPQPYGTPLAVIHGMPYTDICIDNGTTMLTRYEMAGGVWVIHEMGVNDTLYLVDADTTWVDFFRLTDCDFGDIDFFADCRHETL